MFNYTVVVLRVRVRNVMVKRDMYNDVVQHQSALIVPLGAMYTYAYMQYVYTMSL